jgi:iron complex transport system ATP-binding protein
MKTIFDLSNIAIARGETKILDDISWRVGHGEHWVILGGNGSGKTSLLKALGGYFPPTSGNVRLLGKEFGACDWRQLRERIGMVSSSIAQLLHEEDTALEIVAGGRRAMVGYWGTMRSDERRTARRLLGAVEADHLSPRLWLVLSQGERQRVLIARALMARPRLLILDEPCAGLDPVAREHFLEFIDRLGRTRRAPPLILVTHHVEEITPVFTHALLLKSGRVLASGPVRSVITSRFLSEAFGAPIRVSRQGGMYRLALAASR